VGVGEACAEEGTVLEKESSVHRESLEFRVEFGETDDWGFCSIKFCDNSGKRGGLELRVVAHAV
jgi:hypothetical protein